MQVANWSVRARRVATRRNMSGTAAIEFAILLPVLLLLAIPLLDLARAIQANMILVNLSREGANLASRSPETPQAIMNAITQATPPLDMPTQGMVYISKIMGNATATQNLLVEQYRWNGGGGGQQSQVWGGCASWATDGKCSTIASTGVVIAEPMAGQLADGQVIYVVEGLYRARYLFSGIELGLGASTPVLPPQLYARTIF